MFAINHRTKLGFIRIKDLYYAPTLQPSPAGMDVVYYYHCQVPGPKAKGFHTLLIDVSLSPETLLATFGKSTRNAVRRVLRDDSVTITIEPVSNTVGQPNLQAFIKAYDAFAAQKGIQPCNRELLDLLAAEDRLTVATASTADDILCQFLLIETDSKIVTYYGYNNRFSMEGDTAKVSLIGKANRALDYQCMLYTHEKGKPHYDFCGLTLDPDNAETENVDSYKLGFGGDIVEEYHFMKPLTMKGWLFCQLKALRGGIG